MARRKFTREFKLEAVHLIISPRGRGHRNAGACALLQRASAQVVPSSNVRYRPRSGHGSEGLDVRYVPKAHICGLPEHSRFTSERGHRAFMSTRLKPRLDGLEQLEAHRAVVAFERDYE